MRIAQLIIAPVTRLAIEEGMVDDKTIRGEGGFGSHRAQLTVNQTLKDYHDTRWFFAYCLALGIAAAIPGPGITALVGRSLATGLRNTMPCFLGLLREILFI